VEPLFDPPLVEPRTNSLVGTHDVVPTNIACKSTRLSRLVAWNLEGRGMAPRFEPELFHYDTGKALRPSGTWVRLDHRTDKLRVNEVCTSAKRGVSCMVRCRVASESPTHMPTLSKIVASCRICPIMVILPLRWSCCQPVRPRRSENGRKPFNENVLMTHDGVADAIRLVLWPTSC
jgi:hypothetical protein